MKKVLFVALIVVSIHRQLMHKPGHFYLAEALISEAQKHHQHPITPKTAISISVPTIGYQFSDNWTAGLVADIGSSKYTNPLGTAIKTSAFDIGPFIRYAKSLSGILAIYGQLQGAFGSCKTAGISSTTAAIGAFPAISSRKKWFRLKFQCRRHQL